MKTNTNKTLTRDQSASMARRKVKDAKRSSIGGFTFNMLKEFFNVSRFGMIDKEEAVSILKEGDVIFGNEKHDSKKMFSLIKRWNGGICLAINSEEDEHGWLSEAVSVFGCYKCSIEGIDKAIAACRVINIMYDMYGYQCWFKFGAAKLTLELGASEEEAFWIAHYISYQQYMLLKTEEVYISSVQDMWDALRIDNEEAIRLHNNLFHIAKEEPVSLGVLFSYGEDILSKYDRMLGCREKYRSDKTFYKNMYPRLHNKGYWELDAIYHSTVDLIKQGKNRMAKLQSDVSYKNIMEAISATGIDKNKFESLAPQYEGALCEFFSVLGNREFKAFVKSYDGKFKSITDAMCKMLNSRGVKVDFLSIHNDYWNMNTPGCFDALVEYMPELKGRTVNFNTPASIIKRFATSAFETLSDFASIVQCGLDPDEKTEPSSLLRSIKGTNTARMDMWMLPKSDPRNLVIGDITGCCQRIGGAGEDVCIEGWTDPYSVNVAFGNRSKDEFYAHAWVWETSQGDIVLDSVEGRSFVDYKSVSELVLKLARQMKGKGVRVFISDTAYGLTKNVVSYFKTISLVSEAICPDSMSEYSYMDTEPGDKCWLIKV